MSKITLNNILQLYNEIEIEHPIYGKFISNKLYDLVYLNIKSKEFIFLNNYQLFITNNINEPILLYSKLSHKFLVCNNNNMFSLKYNGKFQSFYKFNMIIPSVFYKKLIENNILNTIDNITTDHIDDNYNNNLITNLQFLSKTLNSAKGQLKSNKIEKKSKNVMLTYYNNNTKEYDNLKEFYSISSLVNFLVDNKLATDGNNKKLINAYFHQILYNKNGRKLYNKIFSIYKIDEDIKNEIWINIPKQLYNIKINKFYQISNYGRVKNTNGDIMKSTIGRTNKYSFITLSNKKYTVHYLVYVSFNIDKINYIKENNYVICHNDNAPLYKNSKGKIYYRNYLEDLYIDTHTQNMIDFYTNKKIINEIININDKKLFENLDLINKLIKENEDKIEKNNNIEHNTIEYFMINKPKYIQEINSNKRSFKYELSKALTIKNISLCGSSKYTKKIKFLQAIYAYMKFYNTNQDSNKVNYNFYELKLQLNNTEIIQLNKLINDIDNKI